MKSFHYTKTFCISIIAALGITAPSLADPEVRSGIVDIEEFSIAYLGQATLGHGTLDLGGEKHRFKIGGLGAGGTGVSVVSAKGEVYKLQTLEQFGGAYVEGRAGIVVGDASVGDLWLRNEHGVVMRLKAKREGLMLALGADVITIELDE